jgi:pimeloyl-ACP methyl ester carboxylesterase
MESLSIDGCPVRVFTSGAGKPLVYLHSGSGEVGPIALFGLLEEQGFRITAPELPGFGMSPPVGDWDSIEDVVFFLRRFLDEAGLDRVTLVGSSIGGWLAAELAVWFPNRVDALVLIDAAGLRVEDAPVMDVFMASPDEMTAASNPNGFDLVAALSPGLDLGDDPEASIMMHFMRAMDSLARVGYSPYLHDPRLRPRLPHVTAPTLVLWGAQDGLVPVAHGEVYAAEIPNARLEIIDGCGHNPALENPEAVAAAITSFARAPGGVPA